MHADRITAIMPRAIVRITYRTGDNGAVPGSPVPRGYRPPDVFETVLRIDSVDPDGFTYRAREVWPPGQPQRRYFIPDVLWVEPWDGEPVKHIGPFIRIPDAAQIAGAMQGGAA